MFADGACAVHSFSEVLSAVLRKLFGGVFQFGVDMAKLMTLTIAEGLLKPDGTNAYKIGLLGRDYGIPLQGDIPNMPDNARFALEDPDGEVYVLGTYFSVHQERPGGVLVVLPLVLSLSPPFFKYIQMHTE